MTAELMDSFLVIGEDHDDGRKAERIGYYDAADQYDAGTQAMRDAPGWTYYLAIPEVAVNCISSAALHE